MSTCQRSNKSQTKTLHPRNLHKHGYDFSSLVKSFPSLSPYVITNPYGDLSIDFGSPQAVLALNTALLRHYYHIIDWKIPEGSLCPPIPGRVDYIHYIAELLKVDEVTPNHAAPPSQINLLDIGTGANGIFPLLACQTYGWHCVGTDINTHSIANVASILANNLKLEQLFTLRTQYNTNHFFKGIIQPGEFFDVSVCNPPFHSSQDEANQGSLRKLKNLARHRSTQATKYAYKNPASHKQRSTSPTLNFGGFDTELWCKGGERLFLKKLIKESHIFSTQCRWFTSLVSKSENIKPLAKLIQKIGATDIREIEMVQGNKTTRILAWTYI